MQRALATEDPSLRLPRILCLHGGGTNARIFAAQCRGLAAQLKSGYRLVFTQAPFASQAGPDVMAVYSDWGPFRRWLRWCPEHPELPPEDAARAIDASLEEAVREDNARGATGEWVALLGFSQGAKVCASLLYRQQVKDTVPGGHSDGPSIPSFRFGVLIAGRAPLVVLDPGAAALRAYVGLPDASQITHGDEALSPQLPLCRHVQPCSCPVLRVPTIHVHGTRDPGLELHRRLFEEFCDPHTRRLVQWDGDHRLPLKGNDVGMVVAQIRALAEETGVH